MNHFIAMIFLAAHLLGGLAVASPHHHPVAQNSAQLCVVIALDDSASMAHNDPNNLRYTGAQLFLSLMDNLDQAGVVRFSGQAAALTPELVPFNDLAQRQRAIQLLIPSEPQGYTDLKTALERAEQLVDEAACAEKAILLLSDGKPELPGGLPPDYTSQAAELARLAGVPVYSIALTPAGQSPFLYRVASETGGSVIFAQSAADLIDAYLNVLAQIKDRTVLGEGTSHIPGESQVEIHPGFAPYVQRLTLVVVKDRSVAASPMGPGDELQTALAADGVFTIDTDGFNVYSVDLPAPGMWGFQLEGQGEARFRAVLRSRLRLVSQTPPIHPAGEPLLVQAKLIEENISGSQALSIGEAHISASLERPNGEVDVLDMLYDDGTHGDLAAHDGIFSAWYANTAQTGIYRAALSGFKGVIPVIQNFQIEIVPFPSLTLKQPYSGKMGSGEPVRLTASLDAGDGLEVEDSSVTVEISGPAGISRQTVLERSDSLTFSGAFEPWEDGRYQFKLRMEGARFRGAAYSTGAQGSTELILVAKMTPVVQKLDLEITADEISRGATFQLTARSSGRAPIPVSFVADGLPAGLRLASAPEQIWPGENPLQFSLQGSAPEGVYTGWLRLIAGDTAAWAVDSLPMRLKIIPAVSVTPDEIDLGVVAAEQAQKPLQILLALRSRSQSAEQLSLAWDGPGAVLETQTVELPAVSTKPVAVSLSVASLPAGQYRGDLYVRKFSTGENLQKVSVRWQIPGVPWAQRWGGLLSALITGFGGAAVAILRIRRRNPRPWGKLVRVKPAANSPAPAEVRLDLAARGWLRPRVTLGAHAKCGFRLNGKAVAPLQASIGAGYISARERLGNSRHMVQVQRAANLLRNLSGTTLYVDNKAVIKGAGPAVLKNGSRILIGEFEYEYRE